MSTAEDEPAQLRTWLSDVGKPSSHGLSAWFYFLFSLPQELARQPLTSNNKPPLARASTATTAGNWPLPATYVPRAPTARIAARPEIELDYRERLEPDRESSRALPRACGSDATKAARTQLALTEKDRR